VSRAAFSQAERSIEDGRPIRRFDADEIVAFARVFEKPVGYFFAPPEPHFQTRLVTVNSKPGKPTAHVESRPLSRDEMVELVIPPVPEPKTAAGRRALEAGSNAILSLLLEHQAKTAEHAIRSYLEANPDALAKLLAGDPSIADRINELAAAFPRIETSGQEQTLASEIASASQRARAGARRRKR
jgi:hypothetical protein